MLLVTKVGQRVIAEALRCAVHIPGGRRTHGYTGCRLVSATADVDVVSVAAAFSVAADSSPALSAAQW